MRLTLIKPNIGRQDHSLYVDEARMEPLNIGVLAALTPSDVEIAFHDDRMETIPYDAPTDLVALTVETYTARRSYEIAAEFRQRGVPVVLGGMHPSLLPEEAAQHADAIVLGDAETIWSTVIDDARHRRLKPLYKASPGTPQPGLLTRRDIYEGKGYLPVSLMQFTRGCHYSCSFCAVSSYFEKRRYIRAIDETIAEIENQNRKLIFFVDDNIATSHDALKDLCRELIPLKIQWVSQGTIDMTRDRELMDLMVRSGCLGHVIGFESLDRNSLVEARKGPNVPGFAGYKPQLEILRDYGIQTWAAFTLGYDHDTRDSVLRTLDFALKNHFTFAAFNILMPYPGTPLYRKLATENRLLYDGCWWLHPKYRFNHASFVPALMTPDELTDVCFEARRRFNTIPSLLWRFLDLKTNMRTLVRAKAFWQFNPVFRKEVHKKHGMRFGLFGHG